MGTTEQLLLARSVSDPATERLGEPIELGMTGWACIRVEPFLTLADFDVAVRRASNPPNGTAMGTFVEDSDYSYISAFHSVDVVRLVFNPRAASDYKEGIWALRAVVDAASPDWVKDQAERFAKWSNSAPRQVNPESVRELMSSRWDFAEEPVYRICDEIGLPLPAVNDVEGFAGASALFDKPRNMGDRIVDWARTRYVVGLGRDFVGIWDRSQPGPPIRRYRVQEIAAAMNDAMELERKL